MGRSLRALRLALEQSASRDGIRPPEGRRGGPTGRVTARLVAGALLLGGGGLAAHRAYVEATFDETHPPPGERSAGVHLVTRGTSGIPVVLVHGNPGTALDFEHVQAALGEHTSIAVDRPGYGHSPRRAQPMPPGEQAALLREAVRARGAARVVLAGFSYGGPVVLAWAERHPGEVAAVVFLAAVGSPDEPIDISGVQALLAKPGVGSAFAWTIAPLAAPGVVADRYANAFHPSPPDPASITRGQLYFARPHALMSSAHDWIVLGDVLPNLAAAARTLRMPVEVLSALEDRVVSTAHGRYLAEHIPGAHLRELPAAGHGILATHSATVAATIRRALTRVR